MNTTHLYKIALASTVILFSSCGKKMEETTPIRKDVTETVFASGILEAKNTYHLTAQADGYLTQVNFEEGDHVTAGMVLAMVDNQEAAFNQQSATALYEIAESNTRSSAPALQQASNTSTINQQKMELDLVNYQRYQQLWATNSVAKAELDNAALQYNTSKANYESSLENYKQQLQQANQQLISNKATKNINAVINTKNQVKAVVKGKIFKKYKQPGDYVKRGESIALIGLADDFYARVNIDENNIGKVQVGQQAFVKLNTNKDNIYKAIVSEIAPAFDEGTQSFICKLSFTDSIDFSIVNTQLQSNIVVGTTKNAMLIPRNYVDFGSNVTIKNKKEKVPVVTKFVSNDWVQVLSGIDDNTILVTENLPVNKIATSEAGAAQMQQ